MIKTELFVAKINNEIEEKSRQMDEKLDKLQEDWKTVKSVLFDVQQKHENLIDGYKTEVDKIKGKILNSFLHKIFVFFQTDKKYLILVAIRIFIFYVTIVFISFFFNFKF